MLGVLGLQFARGADRQALGVDRTVLVGFEGEFRQRRQMGLVLGLDLAADAHFFVAKGKRKGGQWPPFLPLFVLKTKVLRQPFGVQERTKLPTNFVPSEKTEVALALR